MSRQTIPNIDLTKARLGSDEDKFNTAMEIDKACKEVGFFVITGHGYDYKIFKEVYEEMEEFFNLPLVEKNACRLEEGATLSKDDYTPIGYTGLLEENGYAYMGEFGKPSDYVEKFSVSKNIFTENTFIPFPQTPFGKAFQEKIKPYYEALEGITNQLTELFSIALDLPKDYFFDKINNSNDSLRLLTYPKMSPDFANNQGCAPHKDGTLLTLLTNTSPGIEVQNCEGNWIRPLTADIDSVIVNIGDLMMRWSNDTYLSTPHKVVLNEQKRQSIAFFKLANDDTLIKPFPKFCTDKPSKYEPIIYKTFSLEKMRALFDK
ncbi:MAG: 2-oxoglutarate and iron-dependent oxygenase domain-containing protein [Burkholderiales bacterium]|nr:2-oxoglutarate and iron-dependent oxygenase domain-containing protein [Burkholderiales bacterium]